MSEAPDPQYKLLDECYAEVRQTRDKVASFYDARFVLAAYIETMSSLIAAILKNKIYTQEEVGTLLADMVTDAFTRKSTTPCQFTHDHDVIVGGKQ